ncbi:hypothetical protein DPMN_146726 [Dreissena polymorpha]|uniref:Uncharacterized protein n=1 Tax=Dreissena polymorpha TaxID=45954 RepID=A0A9D4IZZ3_DREPO|nr:hypothetical protein DPMN_146726 [Dreissena polymorpha]
MAVGGVLCALWASAEISSFKPLKVQSHYDAGGAPVRDPASTGMNKGSTRMNQVFNEKVSKCYIPPG